MNLAVGARIVAVDVGVDPWIDERMIHGGVENSFLILRTSLHGYAAESMNPKVVRLPACRVKIPGRYFCGEIGASVVDADIGNAGLEHNHILVLGRKFGVKAKMLPFFLATAGEYLSRLTSLGKFGF